MCMGSFKGYSIHIDLKLTRKEGADGYTDVIIRFRST